MAEVIDVLLAFAMLLTGFPDFVDAAGGAYSIKFYAADATPNHAPYLPTYAKVKPAQRAPITSGRAADPIADAVAYGPTFSSSNLDAVTSLAPEDLALGQIVPFEIEIKVDGDTAPENGVITFTAAGIRIQHRAAISAMILFMPFTDHLLIQPIRVRLTRAMTRLCFP